MSLIIYFIIGITCIISLILTPIVIKFSKKYGFVDIPKDTRRVHSKPMPRIGGVAMIFSMLIGFFIYFLFTINTPSIALNSKFLGYLIGALVIGAMGIIDDIKGLRARNKFVFELSSILIVYFFGIRIEGIRIPFIHEQTVALSQWISFISTFLWIICVTNAVNLIDGLDGLAAGITVIASTALLIIFVSSSLSLEAIIIIAILLGAALGFLPYNFNPAKTFMGDVGSNFLGFTLACVSIMGFSKGYTVIAIIVPILALGIPIFDTLFAMVRRILKGQPPLKPDGAHIHHRLIKHGFSQRQAVLILYTITTILCIISIRLVLDDIWKVVFLAVIFVCFVSIGIYSLFKDRKIETENINKNFNMGQEEKIKSSIDSEK